jgi:hypothetical protein
VTALLSDTINRVRKGDLDVRVANTVGYLAGVLLKSLEVGDLEDRLTQLESIAGPGNASRVSGAFTRPLMSTTLPSHPEDMNATE